MYGTGMRTTYNQHGKCHDVQVDTNTPSVSGQRRGCLENKLSSKVGAAPDGNMGSIERELSVNVDDGSKLLDEGCMRWSSEGGCKSVKFKLYLC